VHEKERTFCIRFIDAVEVARERGVSVRNLDGKDRRIAERTAGFIRLNGFFVSAVNALVFRIAVKEEL
jgi:hypothetical protein